MKSGASKVNKAARSPNNSCGATKKAVSQGGRVRPTDHYSMGKRTTKLPGNTHGLKT